MTWESVSLLAFIIVPFATGALQIYAGWFFILCATVVVGIGVTWYQFVKSNGADAHHFFGMINALTAMYMGAVAYVTVAYSLIFDLHI